MKAFRSSREDHSLPFSLHLSPTVGEREGRSEERRVGGGEKEGKKERRKMKSNERRKRDRQTDGRRDAGKE